MSQKYEQNADSPLVEKSEDADLVSKVVAEKKTPSKRMSVRSSSLYEVKSKRIAESNGGFDGTTTKRTRSSSNNERRIENIAQETESVRHPVSLKQSKVIVST